MLQVLAGLPLLVILVVIGLTVAWYLPLFGQRVLAFLRDLRNYRAGR